MESPTRGLDQPGWDELCFANIFLNEIRQEDAETRLKDLYRGLHPEDKKLVNFDAFMQGEIMHISEQVKLQLPEECLRNLELLSWHEADSYIVCLVFVLVRYFDQLIKENVSRFQKDIKQDIRNFFVVHWYNFYKVIRKRTDVEKQIALMLWYDAFFTVSFDIPCSIIWMIEHVEDNGMNHYPEQALHCYCKLGLLKDLDVYEFIVWHGEWNLVVTETLLNMHVHCEAERRPKTMYELWKYVKKDPNEFAEHTRLDMPAHGGASTSNQMISIQSTTDDEPVAKKPKLMISNSPISSSIISWDDWESTTQNWTLLIDSFLPVPAKLYFENHMKPLLVPCFDQSNKWGNIINCIKLVISEKNNSSNLAIFNSYPYSNFRYTPCFLFNWSSSSCSNPYSFSCAGCKLHIQIFTSKDEIKFRTTCRERAHLPTCIRKLDEVLHCDLQHVASEVLSCINSQSSQEMIKAMNQRAKNDLDSLLNKSREFLESQKILASLNDLKRVSNDDQRIRCNSRNFKNGKKTSQTQPPKKTPFRIHIENLVYPDQESRPSSSSR